MLASLQVVPGSPGCRHRRSSPKPLPRRGISDAAAFTAPTRSRIRPREFPGGACDRAKRSIAHGLEFTAWREAGEAFRQPIAGRPPYLGLTLDRDDMYIPLIRPADLLAKRETFEDELRGLRPGWGASLLSGVRRPARERKPVHYPGGAHASGSQRSCRRRPTALRCFEELNQAAGG